MSTLTQYAREVHTRSRHATGRTLETPTSITTLTLVFASLATGTVTAGKYGAKWILRREAATAAGADRVRLSTETGFASATGTVTHAGAVYTDTTPGTEQVELMEYEPYLLDDAIQMTLQSLNRSDRYELPTRQGATRYWLNGLTWLNEWDDIISVSLKHSPVLSRNRFFDKWSTVNTSGVFVPDDWTISGAAATIARSTTQVFSGQYSVAITRSGTDCKLTQTVGLLDTGIIGSSGSLRGQQVQVVGIAWSAVASQVRPWVSFDGGASFTYGSYHTGGSSFEELTTAVTTVPTTATNITFGLTGDGSNTVAYGDDCYLVWGPVNDSVRRDDYPELDITDLVKPEKGAPALAMIAPPYSMGSQIVIYSQRPYSGFDQTRLTGGTADADVQDAPLTTVALGALWRLYDGLSTQFPELKGEAARWRNEYELLAEDHVDDPGDGRDGLAIPTLMSSLGRRF